MSRTNSSQIPVKTILKPEKDVANTYATLLYYKTVVEDLKTISGLLIQKKKHVSNKRNKNC
jgi:hypothetical protein